MINPTAAATTTFVTSNITPFMIGVPACLIFICAPLQNKNAANKVVAPVLNKASVKPPISKIEGKKYS
mgnify:CR=1 FL=1